MRNPCCIICRKLNLPCFFYKLSLCKCLWTPIIWLVAPISTIHFIKSSLVRKNLPIMFSQPFTLLLDALFDLSFIGRSCWCWLGVNTGCVGSIVICCCCNDFLGHFIHFYRSLIFCAFPQCYRSFISYQNHRFSSWVVCLGFKPTSLFWSF